MPDMNGGEIVCPACGRANPATARTCLNCATLFTARLQTNPAEDAAWRQRHIERESVYAAELGTVQDGKWREVSTETRQGNLPLPPQVQAEALRREREYARREAEQKTATRLREERERLLAERATRLRERLEKRVCQSCGTITPTDLGETGAGNFSFCLNCGMSFGAAPTGSHVATSTMGTPLTASATITSPVGVLRQQARREVRSAEQATTGIKTREILPITETTPFVSAILSFLLPGAGQLRNGQFIKGVVLLTAVYVGFTMLLGGWGLAPLIFRALIALDAYRIALRKQRGEKVAAWQWDIAG